MNIKKDFTEKTKEYLADLRKKINRKNMLNDEIKLLKERQSLNGGINFSELDIRSQPVTKDISDMIISYDTQITSKEVQIDRIDHDIRMYELYSRELDSIEKKILNLRYLENKKKKSFTSIAEKVKYSKSSVANIHDNAIVKLAFYIYGEDSIYF
ncbi:hypothetical protein [Paraclostridium bifermentans]|uniref:hypothetical protein n=1 Tax=Paraclostridium bifermentans TaxID=1490 RepID=UPI0022E4EC56|nr:hypothetical protein [Paraclostridium bifermentans]